MPTPHKWCWFNHCWHRTGTMKYDAKPKGCKIPDIRECFVRKCCKCDTVQGYYSGWDGVEVVWK